MSLKVGRDGLMGATQQRAGDAFLSLPGRKPRHDITMEPQKRRVKGEPPPEDPRFMIVAYGKDARILDTLTNTLSEPMSRTAALEQSQKQNDV